MWVKLITKIELVKPFWKSTNCPFWNKQCQNKGGNGSFTNNSFEGSHLQLFQAVLQLLNIPHKETLKPEVHANESYATKPIPYYSVAI